MGTRADFYIGRGPNAEWLGSIAHDGYPEGVVQNVELSKQTDPLSFRNAVSKLTESDTGTTPDQGWPWPWEDSCTTDYSYALDDGVVWISHFGYCWREFDHYHYDSNMPFHAKTCEFPNMSEIQDVTLGPRSGVLILSLRSEN